MTQDESVSTHTDSLGYDASQTYHQLSFVGAPPPPALGRIHVQVLADGPLGDHRAVHGGFDEADADPVIVHREFQGADGLWETEQCRECSTQLTGGNATAAVQSRHVPSRSKQRIQETLMKDGIQTLNRT